MTGTLILGKILGGLLMGVLRVCYEYYKDWKATRIVTLVPDGKGGYRPSTALQKFELGVKWAFAGFIAFLIGWWVIFVVIPERAEVQSRQTSTNQPDR